MARVDIRSPTGEEAFGPSVHDWRGPVLWYLCIAMLVCVFRLGSTGAIHNEGIVADGARYMARTGEMLVPHLYNEVYTYKPPLTYWLALGSLELTGRSNTWTLRLAIALTGLLMGLAILVMVGRLCNPRAGSICALAAITSCLMLEKLRIAEHDMPLAAGVGVAVVAACFNLVRQRPRATLWLLCYLALTFAFLAKGVPALMAFFPGLIAAAFLGGRQRRLLSAPHLTALALFLLSATGYVWLARSAGGAGAFAQPLVEANVRGFTWNARLLGMTVLKPLVAWAAFLPWSALLPIALLGQRGTAGTSPARGLALAAAAFAIGGVLAFMLVPTYEVRYFLPLTASMGIVCGLVAAGELRLSKTLLSAGRRIALLLGALTSTAAIVLGAWHLPDPDGVILLVLGFGAAALLIRTRPATASTAYHMTIAALCAWAVLVFVIAPQRAAKRSLQGVAEVFAPLVPEGSWLWIPHAVGDRLSSLFFYLNNPVATFGHNDTRPLPGALAVGPHDLMESLQPGPGLHWIVLARGRQREDEYVLSRLDLEGCRNAAPPEVFEVRVDDLYEAILARPPSPSEREDLVSQLQRGTPLAELGRVLLISSELAGSRPRTSDQELATRLYREILGRDPDPSGLSATISAFPREGIQRRAAAMLTSPEYLRKHPYCGPDK